MEVFNSTGPFEGVADDVELEDIPVKHELYSVQMHPDDPPEEQQNGPVLPAPAAQKKTPKTLPWLDGAARHRMSSGGSKSSQDSVYLPFPL